MTEEELRQKCKERAKIFQQAMESCHSSSPMDCIEWFADRIAELEKENAELKKKNLDTQDAVTMQMYTNKANKEIADKQLTKAKEIIKDLLGSENTCCEEEMFFEIRQKAENFLKESEVEKNEEVQD